MDRGDARAFVRRVGQLLIQDPALHFAILIATGLDSKIVCGLNTREFVLRL